MTTHDYHVTMTMVRIADLKARLSEHLRRVRQGHTLTVLDRDTPVARIVPWTVEALEIRQATRSHVHLTPSVAPTSPTDSLAVLLDDRHAR